MEQVKLFEQYIAESAVLDKENNQYLVDSEDQLSISKFLSIFKKTPEGKSAMKLRSNFGKGIMMAEMLKKNLSQHKFQCRVYRSEWNYGGNLVLTIELRGKDYKSKVFYYNSADSTRQPAYSFSPIFNGTIKPSDGSVEKEWSMGVIHGSYQSISKYDEFMSDVIGVFNDYKRVNGVEFSMKDALDKFKAESKITDEWKKLEPKIEKQYYIAKENAKKVSYYLELRMPRLDTSKKSVFYKTDEPRELRHPDEYPNSTMANSKEYANYEKAQANLSDIIENFCKKHGYEFVWAASW